MAELIYNIKNLFSTDSTDCCLIEYDVDKYHIAAYQRGYKWASDEYGAVTILLNDLWDAFHSFQKQERKEYYLQYITLKRNTERRYLEVIDGQQRLTTLSILLSVFSFKLDTSNISEGKLEYSIRKNFFDNHICTSSNLNTLLEKQWDNKLGLIISDKEVINDQDVYYLFNAALKINTFLTTVVGIENLSQFYEFILKHVKIIVNVVDHLSSEKVFSNLNSNKVSLTEAELIKGLMLTKYSRLHHPDDSKKHFREILEIRLSLGRQWDEMTRWSNQPEINTFYFNREEGMTALLKLVAIQNGHKVEKKATLNDYPLFNFYHKLGRIEIVYQNLLSTYLVLNDWFNENKVFNLLGYLFFSRGSNKNIAHYLPKINYTKSHLLKELTNEVKDLIPKSTDDFFYSNGQDNEIHRVLLALNVFTNMTDNRFNYHRFIEEKWTIEHIFPQTLGGKGKGLTETDKELIIEILDDNQKIELTDTLNKENNLTEERIVEIYQSALKSSRLLNSMGNMCLLTDKDNSSNGCRFFDEKRSNILGRIRNGSFVPKHTFDVFSKMVFESNPGEFNRWTRPNIENHSIIIKNKISNLNFD